MNPIARTSVIVGILALLAAPAAWAQPAPAEEPGDAPAATTPDTPAPASEPAVAPAPEPAPASEPAAAPATEPAPAAAVTPASSTGAFRNRLRRMEEEIVHLKEKVYKSKVRLNLLRERILSNVVAEAWAVITHRNDMGSAFKLTQVLYFMDGKQLKFYDNRNGFLDKNKKIEMFRGNVVPGNHKITVELVYKGNAKLFTYLKGYKFKITSKYTFYASRGRIVKLDVVGYEKGNISYSLEDRPAIRFQAKQLPFNKENIARLTSGKD